MNSKKRNIFRIGSISALALSVIASVFYAVAYSSDYDLNLRHFTPGSVTAVIFGVLFAVAIAIVSTGAILIRKSGKTADREPNQIETFGLWLTTFMFIAFGILSFISPANTSSDQMNIGVLASKVIAPLALLSAAPFALASSSRLRGSSWHSITSCCPILWGSCLLFKYYFDLTDMPLNDPELALTIVSIASLIIFFISESRSALGINTPSIAFFANCLAVCLGGCVSTVRIILSLVTTHTLPSLMENIIFFSVSALAFVRLIVLEFKFPKAEDEFVLYSESAADGESDPEL
ncbi:MAG: hypothetical protein IKM46_06220 [Clostridia bacterium]|nr:hypothetical protein [Clostridia bacterium]